MLRLLVNTLSTAPVAVLSSQCTLPLLPCFLISNSFLSLSFSRSFSLSLSFLWSRLRFSVLVPSRPRGGAPFCMRDHDDRSITRRCRASVRHTSFSKRHWVVPATSKSRKKEHERGGKGERHETACRRRRLLSADLPPVSAILSPCRYWAPLLSSLLLSPSWTLVLLGSIFPSFFLCLHSSL